MEIVSVISRAARLCIGLVFLLAGSPAIAQQCPVIPIPAHSKMAEGSFLLNEKTLVVAATDESRPVAEYLRKEILKSTGIGLREQEKAAQNAITLRISMKSSAGAEGYNLKVVNSAVEIQAGTKEGLFRGATSFLQLLKLSAIKGQNVTVPAWDIEDNPAFSWRGLMLDESRHFFGKEKVKSILDWMAFYKLNRFHWHLTDQTGWRIEIKKYPRLTLVGGIGNYSDPTAPASFYTQEDITEIVRYAAERFIQVIPEIDMPGHATAANLAYPEYSGGGSEKYPEFTFNPGRTATYSYLSNILKEVNVLFPYGMIHIGGDEVHFGNQHWNKDEDVQLLMKEKNLKDLSSVEHYFIRRMADSMAALNSRVLAWDEITNAGLSTDRTLVFWWRHDKPEELKKALDKGYKTVICPRLPLYFDFVQDSTHAVGRKWQGKYNDLENVYSYSPLTQVAPGQQKLIEGFQGNLWTEQVSTAQNLDFLLFPRICALAETAWGRAENKNYKLFEERLKLQLPLFRQKGLYYYDPFIPAQTPEYNHKGRTAQPGL